LASSTSGCCEPRCHCFGIVAFSRSSMCIVSFFLNPRRAPTHSRPAKPGEQSPDSSKGSEEPHQASCVQAARTQANPTPPPPQHPHKVVDTAKQANRNSPPPRPHRSPAGKKQHNFELEMQSSTTRTNTDSRTRRVESRPHHKGREHRYARNRRGGGGGPSAEPPWASGGGRGKGCGARSGIVRAGRRPGT